MATITSWVSTADNRQHIAFVGPDGYLYESHMPVGQPPWSNLARIPGATPLRIEITSWFSSVARTQSIAYVSTDLDIHPALQNIGEDGWSDDDATYTSGAPIPTDGSRLTSWISNTDNLRHIAYIGSGGLVYELYKDIRIDVAGSKWAFAEPSRISGAPLAAGDLTSWISNDNVQHIAYVGTDGPVYELYVEIGAGADKYAFAEPSRISGAPVAAGGLTSWVSNDNLQHIAYVGTDGLVYELYVTIGAGADKYAFAEPSRISGAPVAASGLTSWVSNDNLQHIAYFGTDGLVYELYVEIGAGADKYAFAEPSRISGAPVASVGLTSWVSNDNLQHIAYIGVDLRVYELYVTIGAGADNYAVNLVGGLPGLLPEIR